MAILYHGSPNLFDHFELTGAGDGTGLKFGYGVYLTEVEASAVHYSQPRKQEFAQKHYLYTVEIPDLKDGEYLVSAKPVEGSIVAAVESKLGVKAPEHIKAAGKEFRKWIGTTLTGSKKADFIEEKKAAELLESIGVHYNVWPQAQNKPDGGNLVGPNLLGRLLMELRDNGKLEYKLPEDALDFIGYLK